MKKILILCTIVYGIVNSSFTMMVKLPDRDTLRLNLYGEKLTEFIIATKGESFDSLTNNEVTYEVAIKKINNAFADYYKYLLTEVRKSPSLLLLEEQQRGLATAVLQDNPAALQIVLDILDKREKKLITLKKSPHLNLKRQ